MGMIRMFLKPRVALSLRRRWCPGVTACLATPGFKHLHEKDPRWVHPFALSQDADP